ncbi:hypothetical protein DFJ73DRAFT_587863 [Zopfochytrium polystomum]|nr:hypothetical protein DFJ73DRAFT_587863 [Zopfochytrium polystomum]
MMVACNDMSFALTYPDKRRAVFVRHFHAFSDTEGDSLGGSYLVPEDLRAINIARARLGDALYNGIGLVEGALADALLTDLKEAADTIHSRRPSQPGSAEAVALELGMSNVRWKSVGLDVERASQPVFRSRGVPEVARAPFQEPSADDLGYGHDFSWTEEYDGADEGEQVDKEYEDEDDDDEGGTRGGRWGRRGGAAGSKWLRGNGSDEPLPPSDESFVNQMFWDLSTQYLPPLVWPR